MVLRILEIVSSVTLIVLVAVQERSSGLSTLFGGDSSGVYQTRRGVERLIFGATIVVAIIFVGLAITDLLLRR